MPLAPVIGLETHIELSTKTKMFCACPAHSNIDVPNTNICPTCVGHPGTLPTPNTAAIRSAVLLGVALNGTIAEQSKFDRKNYFYPDLPKAYQISQFDLPIMTNGQMLVDVPGAGTITIGIERMHLEEDSAKNIHGHDGKTYIDFNRASIPLCEIVTKPDFRNAVEAKAYVQELRLLVRMLGISDGDLERGHLRCDVNVSLREVDDHGLPLGPMNPKTEIKNINSFRAIERAITYEIQRQTALWEAGTPPTVTTTRGWNDVTQTTDAQRTKENSADYRYFPEPDIFPLHLHALTEELRRLVPELPRAKRARFVNEYGFTLAEAQRMIDDEALANFTEATLSELHEWLKTANDAPGESAHISKFVASWLLTKFSGVLAAQGKTYETAQTSPENFAEFLTYIIRQQLTVHKGLEVLTLMEKEGLDPDLAREKLGTTSSLNTADSLENLIIEVLEQCPQEVARYRNGETKLLPFFLGQVMKQSRGNADPALTTAILRRHLSES